MIGTTAAPTTSKAMTRAGKRRSAKGLQNRLNLVGDDYVLCYDSAVCLSLFVSARDLVSLGRSFGS